MPWVDHWWIFKNNSANCLLPELISTYCNKIVTVARKIFLICRNTPTSCHSVPCGGVISELLSSLAGTMQAPDPLLFLIWKYWLLSRASSRHRKKERRKLAGDDKITLTTGSGNSGLFCPQQIPESEAGCWCPFWARRNCDCKPWAGKVGRWWGCFLLVFHAPKPNQRVTLSNLYPPHLWTLQALHCQVYFWAN